MTIKSAVAQMERQLPAGWPKGKSVPDELVAQFCDKLWAKGVNPRLVEVACFLEKVNAGAVAHGITLWRKSKGFSEQGIRSATALPANPEELARIVDPAIARAPLTYYDPTNDGRWAAPARKIVSYLGRIENLSLRNAMTLFALLKVGWKEFQIYSRISNFVCTIRIVMAEQNIADITAVDPNDLLFRIYRGEAGHALSDYRRGNIISHWNDVCNAFEEYAEKLSKPQRATVAKFFLRPVTDHHQLARHKPWAAWDRIRKAKIKAKTDIVHAHFHELRFAAKIRLNQARRLYEATQAAIRQVEEAGLTLPYAFHYEETALDLRGRQVRQCVNLRLWDELSVYDEAISLGFGAAAILGTRQRFLERARQGKRNYVLEYVDTDPITPEVEPVPLWFIELYDHHVFTNTSHSDLVEARRAFNERWGYESRGTWTTKSGILSFPEGFRGRLVFIRRAIGRRFFPWEGVYVAGVLGNFVLRVQTYSGARIGEVQQITQSPDCIKELVNVGPKAATRWVLRMVPKGGKERADYYIDEETKDHLMEVVALLRAKHKSKKIPVVKCQYQAKPDRYLLQWDGKGLHQDILNNLLRFLLHGVVLKSADGKTVHITSHILRHAFATELARQKVGIDIIARLLHQRDTSVTKYYAQPTATQIMASAEAIFVDRIDVAAEALRSPDEIARLLQNAEGRIGALSEVVGGTCVVGNLCPVKFACVGCSGNAPDPARRDEVERKRAWALQQLEWARERRLPAEERQMKQLLQDCGLMLLEMEQILAARENASQLVTISDPGVTC